MSFGLWHSYCVANSADMHDVPCVHLLWVVEASKLEPLWRMFPSLLALHQSRPCT
jgi:hypothetical protein